jgi:hypothetical protein
MFDSVKSEIGHIGSKWPYLLEEVRDTRICTKNKIWIFFFDMGIQRVHLAIFPSFFHKLIRLEHIVA